MFKLITASGYTGVRLRIVSIDPGVRNVFVAYSSDGDIYKMSLGEYHSLAKTATYGQRLSAVLAKHAIPDLPVVRSPRVADTISYAAAVAANLDALQAAYGDRRLHEVCQRMHRASGQGSLEERPAQPTQATSMKPTPCLLNHLKSNPRMSTAVHRTSVLRSVVPVATRPRMGLTAFPITNTCRSFWFRTRYVRRAP